MKDEIDDGGPAFPCPITSTDGGGTELSNEYGLGGMSLRDYFAAKAMQGMLSNAEMMQNDKGVRNNTFANYAAAAYIQADAVLAERSKP